jgi:protein-tyrosine sulfotransferase
MLDSHPSICCPAEVRLGGLCQGVFRVVDVIAPDESYQHERSVVARQLADALLGRYCARKRKTRWCDKSPANLDALGAIRAVFPDAQYVCLYRDAFDQARSFVNMFSGVLTPYVVRNGGNLMAGAIERWCVRTERLMSFEHANAEQAMRLTYEKLVTAPEVEMVRLQKFLEVEEVLGLSTRAFEQEHDRGPADPKIARTSRVEADRVGRTNDYAAIPLRLSLRRRLDGLRKDLGYF